MIGRMEVRRKNQITLPKSLTKSLSIQEGDILEYTIENGKIIITPKTLVPKDQAWYWSKEWQTAEREVEQALWEKGTGKEYSVDDLVKEIKHAAD